jgi:predicted adenylyl cyclase CyaB
MARNTEIKARVHDPVALEGRTRAIADHGPELLQQDDTFFHCVRGRLKLREFADGCAELIAYERPDAQGPKTSDYIVTPVPEPSAMREALMRSNGLRGRVRKQRTLYLAGQTRVHLDHVEGLGHFMELEVVLHPDQSADDGRAIARALMQQLGIPASALVAGAYIDLIEQSTPDATP